MIERYLLYIKNSLRDIEACLGHRLFCNSLIMLMSSRPDRHNNIRFVWCVQVIIFCMLGLFKEPIILLRLRFCFWSGM